MKSDNNLRRPADSPVACEGRDGKHIKARDSVEGMAENI